MLKNLVGIDTGPMTMELGFPFTFNFATLYLDKNKINIFSR